MERAIAERRLGNNVRRCRLPGTMDAGKRERRGRERRLGHRRGGERCMGHRGGRRIGGVGNQLQRPRVRARRLEGAMTTTDAASRSPSIEPIRYGRRHTDRVAVDREDMSWEALPTSARLYVVAVVAAGSV